MTTVLVIATLLCVTGSSVASPGQMLQQRVERVEARLDGDREARTQQADTTSQDMTLVTIFIGVAALVITVVAVGTAIMGYRAVAHYVDAQMSKRIDVAIDETISTRVDAHLDGRLERFDQRLSRLFDQFTRGLS
jgi:hypothetical protein